MNRINMNINNLNCKKLKMQINKRKKLYIPPTLHVLRVILDGNIAVQSPVQKVDVKNWDYEGTEKEENNADIWLNF